MVSFDVLFVGAGLSGSYTMIHLLERLATHPVGKPLSFAMIDQRFSFGGGGKSFRPDQTEAALTLTPLRSVLPDTERATFLRWLTDHPTPSSPAWLAANRIAIADGSIEDACIPRSQIGHFVQHRVRQAVAASPSVTVDFRMGEVVGIDRVGDRYTVRTEYVDYDAAVVVLAIGPPPPQAQPNQADPAILPDPSADNIGMVIDHAKAGLSADNLDVLIIGANAAAAEVLHLLYRAPALHAVRTRFTVLSPSGRLPDRLSPVTPDMTVPTPALDALVVDSHLTAEQVCDAAAADLEGGRAHSSNFADTYHAVTPIVGGLLRQLGDNQRLPLADGLGYRLGKLTRWVGSDYADTIDELQADGRLRVLHGHFEHLTPAETGARMWYCTPLGAVAEDPTPIAAAFNCSGASPVSTWSSSPLLRSLLSESGYRANPSRRGLAVDDTGALRPGFFVMGPLLAGNVLGGQPVWHMESVSRILTMSRTVSHQIRTLLD